ncbi:hypothetical protein FJ471_03680 [Mesorhizobium sp. B2-7-1]|nr:hypothetical protein FJ471_03680 [Mesorhizobium sp. B2-7-1]
MRWRCGRSCRRSRRLLDRRTSWWRPNKGQPSRAGRFRGGAPPLIRPSGTAALRYRCGRSSFGKPSNWLSVRYAEHSSPP